MGFLPFAGLVFTEATITYKSAVFLTKRESHTFLTSANIYKRWIPLFGADLDGWEELYEELCSQVYLHYVYVYCKFNPNSISSYKLKGQEDKCGQHHAKCMLSVVVTADQSIHTSQLDSTIVLSELLGCIFFFYVFA